LNPLSTFGTLIVVLLLTSLKEGIEDLQRHAADRTENFRDVTVLQPNTESPNQLREVRVSNSKVRVGDLVRVGDGEKFPADLVLLLTSHQEDLCFCYVETSNIDGETNLKMKQVPAAVYTALKGQENLSGGLEGKVEFEQPNSRIHTFAGALTMSSPAAGTVPLEIENLLLRGSSLRNTKWIYGLVVFTGPETKVMQNSRNAPSKYSSVERIVNVAIYLMFSLQCIIVTISMLFAITVHADYSYLHLSASQTLLPEWLADWFIFLILYNNFIPISLYVTIEMVNIIQARLIQQDLKMYCEKKQEAAICRQSNLCQEIGRIQYIFSDKTGTLTQNLMEFKSFSCGGNIYGQRLPSEPLVDRKVIDLCRKAKPAEKVKQPVDISDNVSVESIRQSDDNLSTLITTKNSDGNAPDLLNMFFTLLAVCHTVVVETDKATGKLLYQAESPDEAALVQAAKSYGYELIKRSNTSVTIATPVNNNQHRVFTIFAINAFNSTRKRMSIAVKEDFSGRYFLFCKGADNIMLERCAISHLDLGIVNDHLMQFSTEGLRTLVLGYRELSQEACTNWCDQYQKAACSLDDRGGKLMQVAENIEKGMIFAGVTAIEDRLQDEVPETIFDLMRAGIKVWVLTGDKEETAINIALSCKLLNDKQKWFKVTQLSTDEEILTAIQKYAEELGEELSTLEQPFPKVSVAAHLLSLFSKQTSTAKCKPLPDSLQQDTALIVDGPTLVYILSSDSLRNAFLKICVRCVAVVACRVSPSQKADIVALVKVGVQPEPVTLGIGDGANDVGMILEAHVGVGISGNEGRQAVNSSDFAIAQFRFLKRLLIVHGRWNYIRVSKVFLYSMHKNVALTLVLFWYSFYTLFSATSFFESYVYAGFNFVLGLPILVVGFTDKDISSDYAENNPKVYMTGRKNLRLQKRTILWWLFNAACFAVIVSLLTYYIDPTSPNDGLYTLGTSVYTALTLSLQVKISWLTKTWTWINLTVLAISVLGYFLAVYVYSYGSSFYGEAGYFFGQNMYWFIYFWTIPFACGVLELVLEALHVQFFPTFDVIHAEKDLLMPNKIVPDNK